MTKSEVKQIISKINITNNSNCQPTKLSQILEVLLQKELKELRSLGVWIFDSNYYVKTWVAKLKNDTYSLTIILHNA